MSNFIERKAISDLLKGDNFYIPSYQRGYRWTSKQVEQLLRDLFAYANGSHIEPENGKEGDYYCLQPIVARKVTSEKVIEHLRQAKADVETSDAWEIIDGQQRLTTIFILYKYLMDSLRYSEEDLKDDYGDRRLYHIYYATRKDSADFLYNIDKYSEHVGKNVDFHFMQNAYNVIDDWICSKGDYIGCGAMELCRRYKQSETKKRVCTILFDLLNAEKWKKSEYGSVQILWYELGQEKDAIKEFREVNNGQIRLTDAELIKALFLRSQGMEDQKRTQMYRAMQWETIENTMQKDDFWYFLNGRSFDMPNRIDFIFNLRYKMDKLKGCLDEEIESLLVQCDKDLKEKNFVFNYFYNKFDGKEGDELIQRLEEEWTAILEIFHTLEDWYEDPITYNLIGIMSQYSHQLLPQAYIHFANMPENESREEFKTWLKDKIKERLDRIETDGHRLELDYHRNHGDIFNLLLLLNVNHLNRQAESADSQTELGSIYKFPFDVLCNRDWDIEHIDSFTTNALRSPSEKELWIKTAIADLDGIVDKGKLDEIKEKAQAADNLDQIILDLRSIAGESEDNSEETKNNIGNLTLLDAATNRSYGNSLFVGKRRIIIENVKKGVYVPPTTQYVFMKLFDDSGTNRTRWGESDMQSYSQYICDELREYLTVKQQ